MAALLIVTEVDPVLVAVMDNAALLPAATEPKSRLEELRDNELEVGGGEPPALRPWQPAMKAMLASTSKVPAALPEYLGQMDVAASFDIVSHGTVTRDSTTAMERGTAQPCPVSCLGLSSDRYLWYMPLPAKWPGKKWAMAAPPLGWRMRFPRRPGRREF